MTVIKTTKETIEETENELRTALKRCRPEVIDAALDYQKNHNLQNVSLIVLGIIERFLEPESRPKVQDANVDDYRLIEDLGIDSLVMVEIVMTIEDVLGFSIPNEDLHHLSTIKDVKNYIQGRIGEKDKTLPTA